MNSYLTLASATLSVSQSLPASGSPLSLQSRERRALSTSSFSRKRAVESTTQSENSDTDISALHPPLDNSGAEHMSLSWRRRDSTADVSSQGFRLQKCRVPELSPKKHRMRIHRRSMINNVENCISMNSESKPKATYSGIACHHKLFMIKSDCSDGPASNFICFCLHCGRLKQKKIGNSSSIESWTKLPQHSFSESGLLNDLRPCTCYSGL